MFIPLLSVLLLVPSAGSLSNGRPQVLPASHPRTACELITRAGVQQALGRVVASGVGTALSTSESGCEFASREGQVSLSLQHLDAEPDMEVELKNLQKALPGASVCRLTGFGQNAEAWLVDLGDAGVQIHMIHAGRDYVLVSLLGLGNAVLVADSARTIAHQVLASLLSSR